MYRHGDSDEAQMTVTTMIITQIRLQMWQLFNAHSTNDIITNFTSKTNYSS